MGLLDWLKGGKQQGMPQVLKSPWVRGDKGEPYCSEACHKKASKILAADPGGKITKCFFCDSPVTLTEEGAAARFDLNGDVYCFCTKCKPQWKPFTTKQDRCCVCRKPYV